MTDLLLLCVFAFLAGFVDSVVGGGGLIQIPALFIVLPDLAPATILGTNKLASIAGTSVAIGQYARHVPIDWRAIVPTALVAFLFSFVGARVVSSIDASVLRPLVLVLLVLVALYTFVRKDLGALHAPKLCGATQLWAGLATGAALGFYDGFFGPGTGSFLIFIFVGIFGFSFLAASASSKVVNFSTNLSAVLYFALAQHVFYTVAVPMAACNILGALAGSRMAILKGSSFVRVFFLAVVAAIILKFAYDTLYP